MLFSAQVPNKISVFDDLDSLTEAESIYESYMVPIKENPRLGQNIIRLESAIEYINSSGISNYKEVIHNICESNFAPEENIAFSVNESSIYEDDFIPSTILFLKESGYQVHIVPISDNSIYYKALEEAFELDADAYSFEDSYHLQQYVFGESVSDTVSNAYQSVKDRVVKNTANIVNSIEGTLKVISNKAAALSKKIQEKYKQLKSAAGSAKEVIKNQIEKLSQAKHSLFIKMQAMKNKATNIVSSGVNYAKSAISNTVDKANNIASKAKNKVFKNKRGE